MKFTIFAFAGKEKYLEQRMYQAGHQEVVVERGEFQTDFDLILLDCDWPWAYPRRELITASVNRGAKVALYPHGGRPTVFVYDGIAEPDERVSLRLEHGPGSIQMADFFAEGLKQEAPGWLYSPTQDFQTVEKPKRILFAPLHPNIEAIVRGTNGHDPAPSVNQEIYRRLLELRDVEIMVSITGPMWRNGVWPHPRVRFATNPYMRFEQSLEQIQWADVVIGAGTMGAAAVASGKPTVMFCQDSFVDYVNGQYIQAEHQDEYRNLVRYPLDTDDGPLTDLIKRACEAEQTAWRDLWVGHDGTEKAIELLEGLVGETKNDVVIQGATARALTKERG